MNLPIHFVTIEIKILRSAILIHFYFQLAIYTNKSIAYFLINKLLMVQHYAQCYF